jgi:hypothetical protein
MYDPTQGRFLEREPLGSIRVAGQYEYGDDCPVGAADPTGRDPFRGTFRVLTDWQKATRSSEFTVRMGRCCRKIRVWYEYGERLVERSGARFLQWRNLTYTGYWLGGKVPCTGHEIGELLPSGQWRVFYAPWRSAGEEPAPLSEAFAEGPPTGTETSGGFNPQMLGD